MKPSWKRTVETKRAEGDEVGSSSEIHSQSIPNWSWRNTVLVSRLSAFISGSRIQYGLSRMLKSQQALSPFAADRAVLWSNTVEIKNSLEEMGLCSILEAGKVYFQRWTDIQFSSRTLVKDVGVCWTLLGARWNFFSFLRHCSAPR